ncbi:MAG: ferrochelatase [Gemmatimonadales bacterium]
MAGNGPERADVGILLLNMGGPDKLSTIRPFLYNVFADKEIIHLPGGNIGQYLLSRIIVNLRLASVKENYRKIGGGSPIVRWTTIQMEGLQRRLNERLQHPPKVGMAMRYWHPFAEEALKDLNAAGVKRVVGLTMYPHFTNATTGSSQNNLVATRDTLGLDMPISFVSQWYDHPGYLDLWARRVAAALDGLEPAVRQRVQLLVSAHGLPERFIKRGDPYVEHIKATMDGVLLRIENPPNVHLGFQSRAGPVRWIGPRTDDVIRNLARTGHDALLVWPIAFVSDHIETTYEVGMLFRDIALGAGITEYHVVPSFNGDPELWDVLADLVVSHMGDLDRVPTR